MSRAWAAQNGRTGIGHIVYATTRGKARYLGLLADEFADPWDFVTFRVRRIPELDDDNPLARVLDPIEHARVYYEQGWWASEGAIMCDECGRYEYDDIPESRCEENQDTCEWVCRACRDHAKEQV
jgi:hypothetical protein